MTAQILDRPRAASPRAPHAGPVEAPRPPAGVVGAEPITTHRERGWIVTGRCGRPHLVGGGWSWWQCPACAGMSALHRITRAQRMRAARRAS